MNAEKRPREELPEHFPTIITEVAACEGIDDIDINIPRIVKRLTDKGLTPEQIDETTIRLSAKEISYGTVVTSGRYTPEEKTVLIFPVLKTKRYTKKYEEAQTPKEIEFEYRWGGDSVGRTLDWTLQHELEHRVVHAEGGMPEEIKHRAKRSRKMAAIAFGTFPAAVLSIGAKETFLPSHNPVELGATVLGLCGVWLAAGLKATTAIGRNAYRKSPEEERARSAESDNRADGFFSVRLSFQNQPIRKLSDS